MNEIERYTPGPWKVKRQFIHGREIVPRIVCAPDDDRQCGRIADLVGAPYLGHQSTLANARLIAAAPDLLEAAKMAVDFCEHPGKYPDCQPLYGMLRAAIFKATLPTTPPT